MQSFLELSANRWAAERERERARERPSRWPSLIHQALSVNQSAIPPTPTYSKTESPTAALCDEVEGVLLSDRGCRWTPETAYYRCRVETLPPSVSDGRHIRQCVFVFPVVLEWTQFDSLNIQSCWESLILLSHSHTYTEPYIRGWGQIEIWPKERYKNLHPGWPRNEPNLHTQTGFPEATAWFWLWTSHASGRIQNMMFISLIFSTGWKATAVLVPSLAVLHAEIVIDMIPQCLPFIN